MFGGPSWASSHLSRRTTGPGHQGCGPQSWAGVVPWKLLELLFPPASSQAKSIQWYIYSTSSRVCLPGAALGLGTHQGTGQLKTPLEGTAYRLRWVNK